MSELNKQATGMNSEEQTALISAETETKEIASASQSDDRPEPAFGWTPYAEQINGRFAMIGFIALLLLQLFTRQDFFTWIGLPK
jgi:hypothetical protein